MPLKKAIKKKEFRVCSGADRKGTWVLIISAGTSFKAEPYVKYWCLLDEGTMVDTWQRR